MVLKFQMWMIEGQVTTLTTTRGKAGLGTRSSLAKSTIAMCFSEVWFTKSLLDIILVDTFTIEVPRRYPYRNVYSSSNWK